MRGASIERRGITRRAMGGTATRAFHALLLALLAGISAPAAAQTFSLAGSTGDTNKLDLGSFAPGSTLQVTVTGVINLVPEGQGNWRTNPDGSLAAPVDLAQYGYANPGSTNYPTNFGGDGTNHYVNGGANFDSGFGFGFAGSQSTDTTDASTVRFGAVVGTFSSAPSRGDWFLIGNGTVLTVPAAGSTHLFVAVNDVFPANNAGSYSVTVEAADSVPEPISIALITPGLLLLGWKRRRQ
jgi:hypothetical protein